MQQPKSPRDRAEDLIRLLVPDWRPTPQQGLWAIRITIVLVVLVAIGYYYDITLWDWIKLLIVPAVIAGGGLWFNAQQREREQQIASERAQDEALQAYLDHMSGMLISSSTDLPSLYDEPPPDSLKSVARARTLTVLPRLDGDRKARVVQFLYESGLISGERPVLDLRGADLRGADLSFASLRGAVLSSAVLIRGNLFRANLNGAFLNEANLSRAVLVSADLMGADLSRAILCEADLGGAFLTGADLVWADLRGANLDNVFGVTKEELEQQFAHLGGATMPHGQKYEDWLKDREGRKEDAENE